MEETQRYPSNASRARPKGSESNLFLSLYQKGFLKTSWRASEFRRARSPHSGVVAIDTALLRGDEGVPPISSGRLGLALRGEELIWLPGAELGVWVCNPLEDWSL